MDKDDATIQHFRARSVHYNDPRRVYLRTTADVIQDSPFGGGQVITQPNPQSRERLTAHQQSVARHNINQNMYTGFTGAAQFGN